MILYDAKAMKFLRLLAVCEPGIQDIDYRCKSDEFCTFRVLPISQETVMTLYDAKAMKFLRFISCL